jgi:arylsulfatase A-like enzyme
MSRFSLIKNTILAAAICHCWLVFLLVDAFAIETPISIANSTAPKTPLTRPNIVLINLDDADREMFRPEVLASRFPAIDSIAKTGLTFTNFHVTTPLCGPSRACLLRGQYAHALGHRTNISGTVETRGFGGDFKTFIEKGYYDDDFGRWMKDAGYRTMFVGKHINQIDGRSGIPAGWDDYYRSQGSRYYLTTRFTNRTNPNGAGETLPEGVYRTNAEAADVARLIRDHKDTAQPLFVYFSPFGPHTEGKANGGMIDTANMDTWPDISPPIAEDFDEADILDKPPAYSQLLQLSEKIKERLRRDYRKRMLATKSVDKAIAAIVASLKVTGRYDNTYIMVTSDNGYSLGQHRISGKGNTMTMSSHVPMIISGPGVPANQTANHLLAHIDIAPTCLELAGAPMKPFFDGKSFAPLLASGRTSSEESWRDSILIENWQSRRFLKYTLKTTFSQLRLYDSIYTQWADGSREFYDLSKDPLELENKASTLTEEQHQSYRKRMMSLRRNMPEPLATVEQPPANFIPRPGQPLMVCGVAEDSCGINKVNLVIRKRSSGEFWNGTGWQVERITLETELKNPNGIQTEWGYSLNTTEPLHTSADYSVVPRAYSNNGSFTRQVVVQKFQYDAFPPVTKISKVRKLGNGKVRINGRARDNYKVRDIRLVLQNLVTGECFDGDNWVAKNTPIDTETNDADQWFFLTPHLAAGSYSFRARAYDTAGNFDPTPEVEKFDIE